MIFRAELLSVIVLVLGVASSSFSQTQLKTLSWAPHPFGNNNERVNRAELFRILDRVEIEMVVIDSKPILIGESFSADDDWLKHLVFHVKNLSNRRLAAIQVTLVLPEMNYSSPDIVYCYGCLPSEKETGIAPGETVELRMLGGEFYDWVNSRVLEVGGMSKITKSQIREMYITLPDGSRWVSGCVKTADKKTACSVSQ